MAPTAPDPVLVAAAALVFVDDPDAPVVDEADLHHLVDVLRLRAGESVIACDGAGRWVPCRVAELPLVRSVKKLDPARVLDVVGPARIDPPPSPQVVVAFAPMKGDRPEWMAQKLTEVGVDALIPLRTARTVVRWDGERGEKALGRIRRIVREAAAQSRRTVLPVVHPVMTLDEVATWAGSEPVLAVPGGGALGSWPSVVAVGPEGGWDETELTREGAQPGLGLGPTVQRAETAAVSVATLLAAVRAGVVLPLA